MQADDEKLIDDALGHVAYIIREAVARLARGYSPSMVSELRVALDAEGMLKGLRRRAVEERTGPRFSKTGEHIE